MRAWPHPHGLLVIGLLVACGPSDTINGGSMDTGSPTGSSTTAATTSSDSVSATAETTSGSASSGSTGLATAYTSSDTADTSSSNSTADTDAGSSSSGETGLGDPMAICMAYEALIEECYPGEYAPGEQTALCLEAFADAAADSDQCLEATVSLHACRAELTCAELDEGRLCFRYVAAVENFC